MKRWISKSYSQCCKGFKYAKDAGKPKNLRDLEDFSKERWAVQLFRTNKELINITKTNRHGSSMPQYVNF